MTDENYLAVSNAQRDQLIHDQSACFGGDMEVDDSRNNSASVNENDLINNKAFFLKMPNSTTNSR